MLLAPEVQCSGAAVQFASRVQKALRAVQGSKQRSCGSIAAQRATATILYFNVTRISQISQKLFQMMVTWLEDD